MASNSSRIQPTPHPSITRPPEKHVHGGNHLRRHHRTAVRQHHHRREQPRAGGHSRQEAERGQLLQTLACRPSCELPRLVVRIPRLNAARYDYVVAHAHNFEAHLLAAVGQRGETVGVGHRSPRGHSKSKFHDSPLLGLYSRLPSGSSRINGEEPAPYLNTGMGATRFDIYAAATRTAPSPYGLATAATGCGESCSPRPGRIWRSRPYIRRLISASRDASGRSPTAPAPALAMTQRRGVCA